MPDRPSDKGKRQPGLFDAKLGDKLRDEAINRVEEHARVSWKGAALAAVWKLAVSRESLTDDDVWAAIPEGVTTHEHRALGGTLRAAAGRGWIEVTPVHVKSQRPECHRRPIPIWRSRVYANR